MSQPVVHFEIVGKDPTRLRKYFGELFGWQFDVPSPVAQEVSAPDNYGFLNLITSGEGTGSLVVSEVGRATRATLSFMSESKMSRQR